ncbi:MAG: hypothetical protein K2M46_10175 [Lachnospiraceae bacterium]|nr:hypothetical protein [Lachnospiraceae bacterium]
MKRKIVTSMLMTVLISLTGCIGNRSDDRFCGSRIGNESSLIMEYSDMNITDCQALKLEAGDILEFCIESKKGQVDITLQMEDENPVYEECNVSTSSFHIDIEESGVYQIIVTGRDAKGSVSVKKAD